jgi:hypothetical protein
MTYTLYLDNFLPKYLPARLMTSTMAVSMTAAA